MCYWPDGKQKVNKTEVKVDFFFKPILLRERFCGSQHFSRYWFQYV